MKWSKSPPPEWVYEKAQKLFGVSMKTGAVFTYYDTIFSLEEPTPDLVVHEKVHEKQQRHLSPQLWWEMFFKDPAFRLKHELEAYQAQYRFIYEVEKDRNKRAKYLDFFAKALSGSMYGKMIPYHEALKQIRNG